MFNHIYPPNPETKIHQTSINININQNPQEIALPSQPIPALLPRDKNGRRFPRGFGTRRRSISRRAEVPLEALGKLGILFWMTVRIVIYM